MKAKIAILLFSIAAFSMIGCNELLDRPTLTSWNDENFWTNEANVKLYANGFYDHSFIGYNQGWTTTATPHMGFQLSDDIVYNGNQNNFVLTVPNATEGYNTNTGLQWYSQFSGLAWNFVWVRKANVMINRLENQMKGVLSTDAYNHWMGVARFFKAIEFAGLVSTFGDVPYYEGEVGSADLDDLYKPRTPRNEVMDAVYDDFVFALNNVQGSLTSKLEVNNYVVAGFVSRWALFEGTWQKYHKNDATRAQKFFELAVRAAEVVINSGRFSFTTDFRSLFGSESLSGSGEVILYKHYDASYNITHCIASECNMVDGKYPAPSLSLVKSFICNDGSDWQTSENEENRNFEMSNLIKTRDPRFEASFFKRTTYRAFASCIYTAKFINREGHYWVDAGLAGPTQSNYTSSYNTNDYPILRYAEVVLNWVEAKAELGNVTQTDIDKSINAIRNRPLAADAVAAGVQRTAPLDLSNLPNSPERGDVSQLLWEIRRERRMEFAFEYGRLQDLRRWKKLEYMDGDLNPDILRGTWVTLEAYEDNPSGIMHLPGDGAWKNSLKGIIGVVDMDGNETVFDGTNIGIQGFYFRTNVLNRRPFLNLFNVNPYLAPVGRNQRTIYESRGYYLAQTEGWPDEY